MKDKNWTDIVSKQGDLRHFASMAIRKSGKSEHTSAQEINFLFRIALSEEPLTPRQITSAMGISKTIVSRLTDRHEQGRSEPWKVTDAPADYLDGMLRAIVGIEIPISEIHGKWKVSQDEALPDRIATAKALLQLDDPNAKALSGLVSGRIG